MTHNDVCCIDCGVSLNNPFKYRCSQCRRIHKAWLDELEEDGIEELEEDSQLEDDYREPVDGMVYDPYNGWYQP